MTQKLSLVTFEDSVLIYYSFLCIIFSVIPDPLTIEHDYLTFGSRVCWKVFNLPVIYYIIKYCFIILTITTQKNVVIYIINYI